MTPYLADEPSNEAPAPSIVNFPDLLASPGPDTLELPWFDLECDRYYYPVRGASVGLQDVASLMGSSPTDHLQLDIDMETFLGDANNIIPQSGNMEL